MFASSPWMYLLLLSSLTLIHYSKSLTWELLQQIWFQLFEFVFLKSRQFQIVAGTTQTATWVLGSKWPFLLFLFFSITSAVKLLLISSPFRVVLPATVWSFLPTATTEIYLGMFPLLLCVRSIVTFNRCGLLLSTSVILIPLMKLLSWTSNPWLLLLLSLYL